MFMPVSGGLVAKGLGTAGAEKPPKPIPPGGGLVALAAAAVAEEGVGGGAPELNSAQRGHLRFVFMCPIWPQWPHRRWKDAISIVYLESRKGERTD